LIYPTFRCIYFFFPSHFFYGFSELLHFADDDEEEIHSTTARLIITTPLQHLPLTLSLKVVAVEVIITALVVEVKHHHLEGIFHHYHHMRLLFRLVVSYLMER